MSCYHTWVQRAELNRNIDTAEQNGGHETLGNMILYLEQSFNNYKYL